MVKLKISSDFEVEKKLGAIYTGGPVAWAGGLAFTIADSGVNVVQAGSVVQRVEEEEDPVLNLASILGKEAVTLVTAHKSSLLRLWEIKLGSSHSAADATADSAADATADSAAGHMVSPEKPEVVKVFRSIHVGPISCMKLHILSGGGRILATGGVDGSVKVWDLDHQYYTHNFRTGSGVCSVIRFHPEKLILYGGFASGALFSWDLTTSKQLHTYTGHYSAVTGFQVVGSDGGTGVSCGRDKVAIVWDLHSGEKMKTVPIAESAAGLVSTGMGEGQEGLQVLIAVGSKLVLWNLTAPRLLRELDLGSEVLQIEETQGGVNCLTTDQNLVVVSLPSLSLGNTVVGNNDEILDLINLTGAQGGSKYLAVACNSPSLRLYKVDDWSCRLSPGHADTVLCLAAAPLSSASASLASATLASGGKDKEIRVWGLEEKGGGAGTLSCLVTGTGHTEAVTGLAFSSLNNTTLVSVSKDTTVKVWNIDYTSSCMSSVRTEIGHEKEINCCDVSPGDELIATGSQDKTAKLWSKELQLVATLRGHRRGVWCCRFSKTDRLLATGSADAVIKLWSLTEFSCIKQLEGHDSSVLKLDWISDSQLVSSASDGLVKVWWVTRQECVATLDSLEEKVWALTTNSDGGTVKITAGSAGGEILTWKDVTETVQLTKQAECDRTVVDHQKLSNLLAGNHFGKALKLALRLSQPFTALKIVKRLDMDTLAEALAALDMAAIDQLLGYCVKWNSNSRHCEAAQSVLSVVLTRYPPDELVRLGSCQDWVEGLLPYTEKHLARLSRLQMKSKFLTYLSLNMKATSLPQESREETAESG